MYVKFKSLCLILHDLHSDDDFEEERESLSGAPFEFVGVPGTGYTLLCTRYTRVFCIFRVMYLRNVVSGEAIGYT